MPLHCNQTSHLKLWNGKQSKHIPVASKYRYAVQHLKQLTHKTFWQSYKWRRITRVLSRCQLSYCDVTNSNRLIEHGEFSNLAVLAYRHLSIIPHFTKIRGFPDVGVGGECKILHGSTLTNISPKFHDVTLRSFGVSLLYIWAWNYLIWGGIPECDVGENVKVWRAVASHTSL